MIKKTIIFVIAICFFQTVFMESVYSFSDAVVKDKLAPLSHFDEQKLLKHSLTACAICKYIELDGNINNTSYLHDVVDRLDAEKNSDITIFPNEVVIEVSNENIAIRYFDPAKVNSTPIFSDKSKLYEKIINENLHRQVIHRTKLIGIASATSQSHNDGEGNASGFLNVTKETNLQIISGSRGVISDEMLQMVRFYLGSEDTVEFLKTWDIVTIADNSYCAGFVDTEPNQDGRRTLYVTETVRAACNIAPEIVPVVILRPFARFRLTQDDEAGVWGTVGTKYLGDFGYMDGSEEASARLAEAVYALRPKSWVVFADIMAGRAASEYLGKEDMDILRPRATEMILKTAKKQGVLAFHYGLDEHAFVFPETWDEDAVGEFFVGLDDSLAEIYPFILPAGAVRVGGEILRHLVVPQNDERGEPQTCLSKGIDKVVGFNQMLGIAEEISGQKFRQDEIKAMSENERIRLWDELTEVQKNIVTEKALRLLSPRGENILRQIPISLIVLYGLPGFNKCIFSAKEISAGNIQESKTIEKKYVLKGNETFESKQKEVRGRVRKSMDLFFEKRSLKVSKTKYDIKDGYTGYNSHILEELLEEILSMTPEEIKELKPEERVIMLRGPPIDFYIVVIGENGDITVLNVDSMFHPENLPGDIKEKVKKELKEGLAGRGTDFVIFEEENIRVYPLKAANSYFGHDVTDNYILAVSDALDTVFKEIVMFEFYGGVGNVDREGITAAILTATERINNSIDEEKFKALIKDKEILSVLLDARVRKVSRDAPLGRLYEEGMAKEIIENIQAMSAVRGTETAKADGEIICVNGRHSRIRTYDYEKRNEYKKAYDEKKNYEKNNSEIELREKTAFAKEERVKLTKKIERNKKAKTVKEMYETSGGVIRNSENITSPLAVFMQYPFQIEANGVSISRKLLKEIADKYNTETKNIRIVFFDDKNDLIKKASEDSAVVEILNNSDGRGVVFCDSDSGIHPGQDLDRDIFKNFQTGQGKSKVYYIKEEIEKAGTEETANRLIGPHVALAIGIREISSGNYSASLLESVKRLIEDISGGSVCIKTKEEVINFINRLLKSEEILRIKKIDFELIREQVKAEEAAMVAL